MLQRMDGSITGLLETLQVALKHPVHRHLSLEGETSVQQKRVRDDAAQLRAPQKPTQTCRRPRPVVCNHAVPGSTEDARELLRKATSVPQKTA